MKIRKDSLLEEELKKFKEWIIQRDSFYSYSNQEYVLTCLFILIHSLFQTEITKLRKELKIPKEWNEAGISSEINDDEFIEIATLTADDSEIKLICNKLDVDAKRYGPFIIEYLYFGTVEPWHYENHKSYNSKNEFVTKAKFEVDYGGTTTPQGAWIRVYKNTTKTGLIRFIEENYNEWQGVINKLPSYPHQKKFLEFKREMQIYIESLLGVKPKDIAANLLKNNVYTSSENKRNLEQSYSVNDSYIYRVISDINSFRDTLQETSE